MSIVSVGAKSDPMTISMPNWRNCRSFNLSRLRPSCDITETRRTLTRARARRGRLFGDNL